MCALRYPKKKMMNNLSRLKEQLCALADSIDAFHERFDLVPVVSNEDAVAGVLYERLSLLMEEVGEHAGALNKDRADNAIDELVDICYIAIGSLHRIGMVRNRAIENTIQKNNRKTPKDYVVGQNTGKLIKQQ